MFKISVTSVAFETILAFVLQIFFQDKTRITAYLQKGAKNGQYNSARHAIFIPCQTKHTATYVIMRGDLERFVIPFKVRESDTFHYRVSIHFIPNATTQKQLCVKHYR